MNIKLLSAALAVSLIAMPMAAFAQPSGCFPEGTKSLFGGELERPMCWDGKELYPGTGGPAPVKVVTPVEPPVVVDPVDPTDPGEEEPVDPTDPTDPEVPPTEIPSTPLEPATPQPGVSEIDLSEGDVETVRGAIGADEGGNFNYTLTESFTLSDGTVVPAGTYEGRIAPNGHVVYRYTAPVVVEPEPEEPVTEVPTNPGSGWTPATPNPGVYGGNLTGHPFNDVVPVGESWQTLPQDTNVNGVVIPAGTYQVIKAPNGMYRAVLVPIAN